jgi:hypothetical protein
MLKLLSARHLLATRDLRRTAASEAPSRASSTKGLWLFCLLSCIDDRQSPDPASFRGASAPHPRQLKLEPQRRQLILDGLVCPPPPTEPLQAQPASARQALLRRVGDAAKQILHALSSFQRTKAPPAHSGTVQPRTGAGRRFPATFAFASVAPFRGTFRAYDAAPILVNPHFRATVGSEKPVGVENRGLSGWPPVRYTRPSASDRRHRVKRITDTTRWF